MSFKKLKKRFVFINIQVKFLLVVLLLFTPFYFFRFYHLQRYDLPEEKLVKIKGRVIKQPYLKGSYQIIELNSVLIRTQRFPGYFYGDQLEITGRLKKQMLNPFRTRYLANFPAIKKIEEKQNLINKTGLKKFLFKTRGQIERKIGGFLPEPHGSLLLGILFGMKTQIPQDFWQDLRKTGTLHLVVASGQNVSLVAGFLMASLIHLLDRRKAILMANLGILFYVLMVGAEPPAVRAGIMVSLAFLGQLFGREGKALVFLLASALIMLLISPLVLFDVGFQLSFMATLGILVVYPILKAKNSVFKFPLLGDGLAVTIAAQSATLPILLVNFGQVSWLSPLINALVLPTIPFIMVLGGGMLVLSWFSSFLTQLLAYFAWLFLNYFVKVVEVFGNLFWVSYEFKQISGWWAVVYYLLFVLILLRFYKRLNERS